ncbi:hypothetical protein [Pseudaminobacter salicylatoxidans]|uniref:hypothetical protein n=1 Tax=Pseudaminobacter salicylatoxidans TaxID=93369 RepID=UPI0002D5C282|nr:hypothetical protein [Pseudaminobacter salicylatoxidans]
MSSNAYQYYLSPDDMTKIERVLAEAGNYYGQFERLGAANYLTRKFQEGVTEETALMLALHRYLKTRGAWQHAPAGGSEFRPPRHHHHHHG